MSVVTSKPRTFTDQERATFTAYLNALAKEEFLGKIELPFGNDTTLNISFFLWQAARDDVLELAEALADTEDDITMFLYKLRKAVVLNQPYPAKDWNEMSKQ